MKQLLNFLFIVPQVEDPIEQRGATYISRLVSACLVIVSLLYFMAIRFAPDELWVAINIVDIFLISLLIGLRFMIIKGNWRPAAIVLLGAVWILCLILPLFYRGMHDPLFATHFLIMMTVAYYFGFRPSVILLFVTAIGTTFVAYAHEAGLVQTVSTDAISHWFDYSYWLMALIIMLAVIYLSTQRNEDARNALQAKNRILADQKIALEAQQLKLKEYQYHLEDLVAQRTDELLGAKEQAEEASRAKSDFLAKMSHELRTPLNAIIGYGEMVEEELVDAEFDPDVIQDNFRIQVSGKHLLTIIDNILDLTKIEKGQLVPHLDKVEVWPLVEEIILFARPLVVKGGNEIRVVEPTEGDTSRLLAVNADRQMVKQVLLNLISNAAKFTQNGLIELKIAFDERQVFFELTDSGVGIDTEFLPYIFEPFQQGENSMNRKYEGTGLGLTIAHEMVRQMGGDIRAANVKNGGAKFEFELNRHVSSRVTAPQR